MSITVFQKQGVQIYRVTPPDRSGYHAANWAKCLTLADLQVKLLDSKLTICLRSHNTGDVVEVPVREGPLQRTLEPACDSSRAFATRWPGDGGRAVWMGLMFDNREDSLNFYSILQLHHGGPAQKSENAESSSVEVSPTVAGCVRETEPPSLLNEGPPSPTRQRRRQKRGGT
eukprot:Protomagalhaensia_wolfi_Nauph_80__6180@NODE_912_length_1893_cov_35_794498_g686_i0_p2_GENE_NODE_912_length_1893_cov_35_794498_g686_i0NODE_912_length_1893_cov_35_794498_g686_i0_p2_ORF_typecomplete_len172_score11_59DUF1681/PF07933_14/1_4e17_NODE_912_length_1893_cov_35_794498_g686_i013101825